MLFSTKTVEKPVSSHSHEAAVATFTETFSGLHHAGAQHAKVAFDC